MRSEESWRKQWAAEKVVGSNNIRAKEISAEKTFGTKCDQSLSPWPLPPGFSRPDPGFPGQIRVFPAKFSRFQVQGFPGQRIIRKLI